MQKTYNTTEIIAADTYKRASARKKESINEYANGPGITERRKGSRQKTGLKIEFDVFFSRSNKISTDSGEELEKKNKNKKMTYFVM